MASQKKIAILCEGFPSPGASGATALSADPAVSSFLRFRIAADAEALEALLHARRSMLREEWTIGRGADEPSLEDAVFSSDGILWAVRPDQEAICLEKIAELEARAARMLSELTRA